MRRRSHAITRPCSARSWQSSPTPLPWPVRLCHVWEPCSSCACSSLLLTCAMYHFLLLVVTSETHSSLFLRLTISQLSFLRLAIISAGSSWQLSIAIHIYLSCMRSWPLRYRCAILTAMLCKAYVRKCRLFAGLALELAWATILPMWTLSSYIACTLAERRPDHAAGMGRRAVRGQQPRAVARAAGAAGARRRRAGAGLGRCRRAWRHGSSGSRAGPALARAPGCAACAAPAAPASSGGRGS